MSSSLTVARAGAGESLVKAMQRDALSHAAIHRPQRKLANDSRRAIDEAAEGKRLLELSQFFQNVRIDEPVPVLGNGLLDAGDMHRDLLLDRREAAGGHQPKAGGIVG